MLSKRILVLMFVVAFLPLLVGCFPAPTPPNETPIITSTPITTATVGVTYVYDVNATDPDGDTLTYSLITKPTGMTINSANGLIKWIPVAAQIGNNSVTVKVSDKTLSILQSFTIKVSTPPVVNQAPIIYSTPITTATVGVTYVYDVNATDPDGDVLTYSLTTKPDGMTIGPTTGVITWIPNFGQLGDNAVTVGVSDGDLSVVQSFTIKVSTPPVVNQAPIITSIPSLTAIVGVDYVYEVKATDPDGDTLTYSLVSGPTDMDFVAPATISWIPDEEQIGANEVIVKASDGKKSITQNFTIIVEAKKLTGIDASPDAMTLFVGNSDTVKSVTAHYNDGSTAKIPVLTFEGGTPACECESRNENVATVTDTGLVAAVAEGTTIITVSYTEGGITRTDTIEVTVKVPIKIDGILTSGEWDDYFLGTSVTDWSGGMSVDVYGYTDDTYLYAAYEADMSEPGWSTATGLCISANLDYMIPQSASWPDPGCTHISVYGDGFAQTDGSDWNWPDGWGNTDPSVFTSRGIEYYVGEPCYGSLYPNIAEIKIPLSLLTYAGNDGKIALSGQYWQYDWAEPFYVDIP